MSEPTPITDLELTYLVRPADRAADEKPPLLLLLHGIGSNERDLFAVAEYLDAGSTVISVRAPLAYDVGHSWFDFDIGPSGPIAFNHAHVFESRDILLRFIDAAVTRYDTDPQRVYIGGFSQGAIMSLMVGLTQPGRVAGVASMSGYLTPDVEEHLAPREALAGLPILMTHGVKDGIIPIALARHTRDILMTLPVDLRYHEFDMGHDVTLQSLEQVLLWTSEQLANPWHSTR